MCTVDEAENASGPAEGAQLRHGQRKRRVRRHVIHNQHASPWGHRRLHPTKHLGRRSGDGEVGSDGHCDRTGAAAAARAMEHRGYTAVANVEVKHFVTHAHHNATTSASAAASAAPHNGGNDRVQPGGRVGHEDELVGGCANPFGHDALRLDHVRKQLAIDELEWLTLCMRPPRRGDCDTEAAGRSEGAVIDKRPARVEPKVRVAQRMAEDGHRRSRRLGGDDLRHGGGQGWRPPFAGSGCSDHLLDGGAVEARARQRRVGGRRARRHGQPPRRRRSAAPKPTH